MNASLNELWDLYTKEKNQKIRNEIVESYYQLVDIEAIKIKTPIGIEKQDIYQFGVVGLIKAVEKYDPTIGAQFESYASYRIKGEIKDSLRKYAKYSQGVTRSTLKKIKEMEQIKNKIETEKNDKANEKEIMEYLNLEEKEFCKLQLKTIIYNGVPIEAFDDNPNYEKKGFDNNVNAESQIIDEELKLELKKHLNKLKEKEKFVIEQYYFNYKNTPTIAKELDVSDARISQLRHDAIQKLRNMFS